MTDLAPVRVPGSCWFALQALLHGEVAASEDEHTLRLLGLVDDAGHVAAAGSALCHGYVDALAVARVTVGRPEELIEIAGWWSADRVALVEVTEGDRVTLRRQEPGTGLLALATLLGLAPRPVIETDLHLEVDQRELIALMDAEDPRGAADVLALQLGGVWPGVRDALVQGQWRCWFMDVHVVAEDPPRARGSMCVLDTPAGVLGADLGGEGAVLVPLTMADVWLRICQLLGPAA